MNRLTYIRFATYLVLVLAFMWPKPKQHAIPVDLASPVDLWMREEAELRKRQDAVDILQKPGFEITKKSGSEVLRLAVEHARKNGSDLSHYRRPRINLFNKEGKMTWIVSWDMKGTPVPGGFFGIVIDDETGAIELVPGM